MLWLNCIASAATYCESDPSMVRFNFAAPRYHCSIRFTGRQENDAIRQKGRQLFSQDFPVIPQQGSQEHRQQNEVHKELGPSRRFFSH
jgi:hypothetical protein